MSEKDEKDKSWWYTTDEGSSQGPIDTASLVSLFEDGKVDGLTRVSSNLEREIDKWKMLSEHKYLREAASKAMSSDEVVPDMSATAMQQIPDFTPVVTDETLAKLASEQIGIAVSSKPASEGAVHPDLEKAMATERKRQSRKRAREAAKLKKRVNTSIYVTGIPTDASEKEVTIFFSKCGIILPNPETGTSRVKLYRDDEGNVKGDALITYALAPSVENALVLLDGTPLRAGGTAIEIQMASFDHKKATRDHRVRNSDAVLMEETEKKTRRIFKGRDLVNIALSWGEDGQANGNVPRIVILMNVFEGKNVNYSEVRADMEEGCAACGVVEKITIFERNVEGAVAVRFTSTEACLKCIEVMNGRWYDGRRLSAKLYDGVTDYRYKETDEDRKEREEKWKEWLEKGGEETRASS